MLGSDGRGGTSSKNSQLCAAVFFITTPERDRQSPSTQNPR